MNSILIIVGMPILFYPVIAQFLLFFLIRSYKQNASKLVTVKSGDHTALHTINRTCERIFTWATWISSGVLLWAYLFVAAAVMAIGIYWFQYSHFSQVEASPKALFVFTKNELGFTMLFTALTFVQLILFGFGIDPREYYKKEVVTFHKKFIADYHDKLLS